jgi:nucleosome binding factor SPN SPT16 subunit
VAVAANFRQLTLRPFPWQRKTEVAAHFSSALMKEARQQLQEGFSKAAASPQGGLAPTADFSHKKMAKGLDEYLSSNYNNGKLHHSRKFKPGDVKFCHFPLVQSGGACDLTNHRRGSKVGLKYDIVIVSLGVRCKGHCAYVARTYFFSAADSVQEVYSILKDVHDAVIAAMTAGTTLKAVYATAVVCIKNSKRPI